MAEHEFDLTVIGGGPGGYVAAIRASQLGMNVALVEANHLGGICLNWGCIPTKALLRSAEIFHHMKHADAFGLSAKDVSFDLKKVVERSRGVAGQLSGGIGHLLKKNKVTVFDGFAKLIGNGKISVDDKKEVIKVRYNNRSIDTINVPQDKMRSFYKSYRHWSEVIERDELKIQFKLSEGDLMLFDNTRVMHARTEFSKSGKRHLQGAYSDLDGLYSLLNRLEMKNNND